MAETVDHSAFWLPSEFLTEEDLFLMANPTALRPPPPSSVEIPRYRRSSSALNSPGESVNSSTETESSEDPDEFIAELTRHLAHSAIRDRAAKHHYPHPQEKSWCDMATSPQSTLIGFTGWTISAPPPNHEEAALELIYAAAERVAKMRMDSQAQMMNHNRSIRRGLLNSSHMELRTPPVRYNASHSQNSNTNQIQQMKSQLRQSWLNQHQLQNRGANPAVHGLHQTSFPPLRAQQQSNQRHHHCNGGCGGSSTAGAGAGAGMRPLFLGGSVPTGVKRQSAGTGVFLPRRVSSNNTPAPTPTTDTRKKQGSSTVLVPARVAQALNLNIDQMNSHSRPHPQTNHEMLVGRRNAAMAAAATATQQRRGGGGLRGEGPMSHHETPLLPQEWTY